MSFARKTSGLVKELGVFDSFSINLISLGPAPSFALFLTIQVFVPGANLMWAVLLAAAVGLPIVATYTILAVEMPRSGGLYVYPSRLLHPFFGIVVSLSLFVVGFVFAAIIPFWFATLTVGPGLATWGSLVNNPGMEQLGNALTPGNPMTNNLLIGILAEILTVVVTSLYILMKPRPAFNLLAGLLLAQIVGLVLSLALLAAAGHAGFVNAVNSFMATHGYTGDYYGATSAYGVDNVGSYGANLGSTLIFVPLLFAFYYIFSVGPNHFAGEFRGARRTLELGMGASYLAAVLLGGAIVWVFENVVGMDFLNGSVWTSVNPAGGPGMPPPMPFNAGLASLPMLAAGGNNLLLGLLFVGALSWFPLWMILNFTSSARYALALSLDRMFPRGLSAVGRRTHSPYAGILLISGVGGALIPVITYSYTELYYPLLWLLFFLPMIVASLTCLSLVSLGIRRRHPAHVVLGMTAFLATAVSAYFVLTMPSLGTAAGFTPADQTASLVGVVAFVIGSALWYFGARGYNKRWKGLDVDLVFKELPPD